MATPLPLPPSYIRPTKKKYFFAASLGQDCRQNKLRLLQFLSELGCPPLTHSDLSCSKMGPYLPGKFNFWFQWYLFRLIRVRMEVIIAQVNIFVFSLFIFYYKFVLFSINPSIISFLFPSFYLLLPCIWFLSSCIFPFFFLFFYFLLCTFFSF